MWATSEDLFNLKILKKRMQASLRWIVKSLLIKFSSTYLSKIEISKTSSYLGTVGLVISTPLMKSLLRVSEGCVVRETKSQTLLMVSS